MISIIGAPTLDDALSELGRIAAAGERAGRTTLVFCEDRLTMLAERAVLDAVGGTFLTEVTTFARFLSEGGRGRILSKQGSVMAISAILERESGALSVFGRNAAQAVYETIAQLSASRVTAVELRESAEGTGGALSRKLSDLAYILEKYDEFLAERGMLDENGYLALLPAEIEKKLSSADVVFFAFPSFTRQALEGVRAAMRCAKNVSGIFLAGGHTYFTNEAASSFRKIAEEEGGAERRMLKSSLSGEAALLADALFSPEPAPPRRQLEHIHRLSGADEAEDADVCAALIRRMTAAGKRYRDVAVLVGDTSSFAAVEQAFEAYRIPYYADRKRPYSRHPFCIFALAALAAAGNGGAPREVDDVAASVYFGDGGEYRNYLRRYGCYRGAYRREIRADASPSLGAFREKMCGVLSLFKPKATGRAYAEGVRKLWEYVKGEEVTESLRRALEGEEREFLSPDRLFGALDEAEAVVGDAQFTAREFSDLLKSSLDAFEVSLFPERCDAVFVGDVTDSKIYRSPVLFALGLSDALPRVSQDTAVITDGELKKLKDLGAEIEPAIAVVNARAREAFALNLTSFSEELYLGCPARIGEKEAAAGQAISDAASLGNFAPIPPIFPYNCAEKGPALLAFFADCDAATKAGGERRESLISRYSSIREALLFPEEGEGVDPDRLRDGAGKEPTMEAADLYFSREVSPTLLETYFECPYKSFAMRGLRLEERQERTPLDAAGAGSFVHAVLERAAKEFNEIETEESCRARARLIAEELLSTPKFSQLLDTAAGNYRAGRLIGEAVAVAEKAYIQLKGSRYRVSTAEAELRIRELGLCGRADRVDVAETEEGPLVRVVDYKTGKIDDSAIAYYTGRKLQLQLYLSAAGQGKAAGAFYFPAADDITAPEDEEGKFRMRGFYCSGEAEKDALDPGGNDLSYFGGRTERAMPREVFDSFLDYARLVSAGAEEEMKAGNVRPSPYEGACAYCALKGACGFVGEERKERGVKCADVAEIAAEERGK